MNWIQNILPPSWAYTLGWTVIHSLWQGVLIASIMAWLQMGLQQKSAAIRYRIAYGALLSMLISAIATFLILLERTNHSATDDFYKALILRGLAFEATVEDQSFMEHVNLFFNENLYFIVLIWFMGVVFFSLRLMGGLIYVQQLRTQKQFSLSAEWQSRMNFYKNKLGVRYPVSLVESTIVNVPMVVGWLKPMILLPIGTANAMSTAEVEAILIHELAHIASRDYILNIVQSIIEILFYYHPAAWWISANIRAERENRCDDVAVLLCGNSLVYAKALLSLQEMQSQNARAYGLAMTLGTQNNHFLLKRIKRILNQPQNRSNIMEKFTATALLLAVVTALSFGNNQTSVHKKSDMFNLPTPSVPSDSFPIKGRLSIVKEEGDKKVEMHIEGGNITDLKIDGKDIPKEDFGKYADLTDDITDAFRNGSMPPPPPPPPAPAPPPPPPPVPPMPPALPVPPRGSLKKEKDSQGNTILKMKKADGSVSEIKITPDKDVFVDGKKMEEGTDMKFNLGDNHGFNFDDGWQKGIEGLNNLKFDINLDGIDLGAGEDISIVMPNMKNIEEDILRRPRSFYFMDKDSMVGGDSVRIIKLKKNLEWTHENEERIREKAHQMADKARENARRMQRDAERIQRDAERMGRDRQREMHEKQKLMQEKIQKYHYQYQNGVNTEGGNKIGGLQTRITRELKKDGFLQDGQKKYKFELTDKKLKINGKEQSKEMHDKYMKLYQDVSGFRSDGNFIIKFNEERN